jgi:hypothetical protein
MSDETLEQQTEGPAEPAKSETKRPASKRKLRANRKNAQKSTGPRTAGGKRYSSFNAVKHGLLAKKVMFAADGTLADEDFERLFESLRDTFGCGDVASELLSELVAVDYWRLQKGLEHELKYLSPKGCQFHPQGGMPTLVRYMTANRRALEKSLQILMQLRGHESAPDEAETERDKTHEAEVGGASTKAVGDGNDW